MNWKDRLNDIKFTITTGDGKQFTPLWKGGEKSKDYNISKYDFINVEKSFVDRKKAQSNKFPLLFWFQGAENIDEALEFETSADDPRMWTIEHPFYGTIKGQPTNLKIINSAHNLTEINIDFWESLTDDYPSADISVKDEVKEKAEKVNETAIVFMEENAVPEPTDINTTLDLINDLASKFEASVDKFNEYNAIVEKAANSATLLISDTLTAISDFQEIINFPATFTDNLLNKVSFFKEAFETIKDSVGNLFSKYSFESNSASIMAGMCNSIANSDESEFMTRDEIVEVNNQLLQTYEEYLQIVDDNQVSVYNIENAWSPNIEIQLQLQELIVYTSSKLFVLSFEAKQERTVYTKKASNLILLTHKYMGLDEDDVNMDEFRKINNIKNKELFDIPAGREIKYYV